MLCMVATPSSGQGVDSLLKKQRRLFPQEKAYVMTDRDLYLAGDTARMRAWIYDCNSEKPQSMSRFLYVELRDAADNLKVRVKLRATSPHPFNSLITPFNSPVIGGQKPKERESSPLGGDGGGVRGYIALPPTLTTGDYTLVAYSYYMMNTSEKLFFKKLLHVMNPKDISKGLLPTNLTKERPVMEDELEVPEGANVAISITADRLCLADSTSNIVWSLRNQPDLFTTEDIREGQTTFYTPKLPYEGGQTVSGTVFGNLRTKKVQPGVKVSMMIPSQKIANTCVTDAEGRFQFSGFNLPDSTLVFLSAKKGKRTRMDNIRVDGDSLPEHITHLPAMRNYYKRTQDVPQDMKIVSSTVDIANTQLLAEIMVKGEKKERVTETYQNLASRTLVADELMDRGIRDLESALLRMPGVQMMNGNLCYRGKPLRFFVDGLEEGFGEDYNDMSMPSVGSMVALSYPMDVIQRIDFIRPEDTAFLVGGAGMGGMAAVCITLKDATDQRNISRSSALKLHWPLGYQKYKKMVPVPATESWPVIFWNSNYTVRRSQDIMRLAKKVIGERREAGDNGAYTLHIDGFTKEGKPLHVEKTFF